jgi:hypothetical protein
MATIGKLAVQITADTQGLKTGLNDAVGETDRASKSMINSVKAIGAAFAASLTVDLFKDMIVGAAAAGRQIDQLSRLSNTSTTEFQRQAYATQQLGISSEKLADIFKDVQDKAGQFLRDGGGPMQAFFEQIAPKVGVTAEQFRNLGGPDALQLYVSSLQKANLSQSEMVAYMEELASDSALLLPLLQNNGKAMKELGDEAQRLGVILDNETIEANKEFSAQLDRLNALSTSLSRTIGSALIPEINRLINEMLTGIETAGGFWKALSVFGTINPFKDLQGNLKSTREEIDTLTAAKERYVKAGSDTSGIDQALATEKLRLEYLKNIERQQIANQKGAADNESGAESRRLGLAPPTSTSRTMPPAAPAQAATPATGEAPKDSLDEWFANREKKQEELAERERQYWAGRINTIQESLLSESELLTKKHAEDLARLDAAVMSEDERRIIREELEFAHLDRMTDIEQQGRDMRIKAESDAAAEIERIRLASMTNLEKFTAMSYQEQAMSVGKAMTDQLTSVSTNSRAMFNIQKAANISQAIMDTYAGANRALKDYPAPWSYAVAGATLAAGLSRVASIKSQTFGGASTAAATAGGGGVAATSGMAQQAGGVGGGGMNQSITVQGIGSDALFSGDAVRTLIDRLIDAQRNGARIVLA